MVSLYKHTSFQPLDCIITHTSFKMNWWLLSFLCSTALAATPAQWRSQSVYFLLTDRFARDDGSTTASCNTEDRVCLPENCQWTLLIAIEILWWHLEGNH